MDKEESVSKPFLEWWGGESSLAPCCRVPVLFRLTRAPVVPTHPFIIALRMHCWETAC